ncbi:hypothetical protein [Butyrivibrio sp. AC2005]|uniref:hypothetical protein n=1 Tax=Butyrivibrio sp. AC2005 TaxID=1280672 RepID=UPI00042775FD|nr:hypothetical protein [Butyrivibrio sp. AC2005]
MNYYSNAQKIGMSKKIKNAMLMMAACFVSIAIFSMHPFVAKAVDYSAERYNLNTNGSHFFTGSNDTSQETWYKFTLDKTYILGVTLDHVDAFIYDSNDNLVKQLYCMDSERGTYYTALLKGDYYIKIINGRWRLNHTANFSINTIEPDVNYQSFVESYNDPSSRNDSEADATPIVAGKTYHGILGKNNPIDWYKVKLNGKTKVRLTIKNIGGYPTTIEVFNESGNRKMELIATNETKSEELPAGTYTIHAERYNWAWNDSQVSYQIDIGDSVDMDENASALINKKPSVTAKKGGKLAVKWKKASDVTGYEIQISTKKNFKSKTKKYTVKENSTKKEIKLPKKYRGKKIYVRVRAYSESNGEKIYSSWSKTKSVKSKM